MNENLNNEQVEISKKEKFYKRWWFWLILALCIVVSLIWWLSQPVVKTPTSNSNKNTTNVGGNRTGAYIAEDKIDNIYISTKAYKGMNIKITGEVFNVIKDSDGIQFQMYRDIENSDQNTIVYYPATNKTIKDGDFIWVDGYIDDTYTYTNAYGGTVSAPVIVAYNIKQIEYKDAVRPTLKEVNLNKSINQHGINVIVEKVEFAEKETRVYITVENKSGYEFNLWEYSSKIIQSNKQYEYESNYDADYEEIQSEILNGVSSSGVLTFPAITQDDFQLILRCSSDNYNWSLNSYTFNIVVE